MYHVSHQGQQLGPFTVEQINQYLAQGLLDASSHIWDSSTNNWVGILEVPGVGMPPQVVPVAPQAVPVAPQAVPVAPQAVPAQQSLKGKSKVSLTIGKICLVAGAVVILGGSFMLANSELSRESSALGNILKFVIAGLFISIGLYLTKMKGITAYPCPNCDEILKSKKAECPKCNPTLV
ncbi:MAG: DUF4339 domain-containing protein [Verrucomicrobia bacterium]|nr:DUF4339 domain-containing protein [Verrucomicrobiota bacterium]